MVDIVQEQKILIEKLVRANSKFVGNEDLLEDFCNEVYKRSCHVLNGLQEVNALENYLRKIVKTAILNVLKDLGRVRRLSKGYTSEHREIPISSLRHEHVDNSEFEDKVLSNNFSYDIQDNALTTEDILISKDLLVNVVKLVFELNITAPDKRYLDIFKLRYKEHKKQNQIAQELGLSQSEISKRLVEISKFVKNNIDK